MATSSEEWEFAKENIQPLQQGRKPEVLKVALTSNPEDLILQQRQAFENELRTYTGDDPLSIWCKYIKWVEQNYFKGGKDGHIEQLIQKCLSILKDKSEYFDDNRFIEIWLKFANIAAKPTEVYNYMYSHKIGCKSATYFIAWSWELESQGSISKADQVLNEGIRRKAEPFEKLKSYRSEFEMRVAAKVITNSVQIQNSEEPSRAAFAVLKPVKKKNVAPVVRVGDRVVDSSKVTMTVGHQQPLPKNNLPSGKVPFKIYNGENIQPSLPLQSENLTSFVIQSDNSKENEKRPSKWNKVKLKQMPATSRSVQNSAPGFKLHCDESLPSENTPKSIPKVSNILRARKEAAPPPLALFEPPDPMKKPMYDKEKVYGGAEEFSFEEIRAAEWFKKKKDLEKERKLAEQERILHEQEEQINKLKQELQLLKTKQSSNESDNILEKKNAGISGSKNFQNDKSDAENSKDTNTASIQKELFPNSKLLSTSTFREASYIVRDFYNDTISQVSGETSNIRSKNAENPCPPQSKTSASQDERNLVFHDPLTIVKSNTSTKNASAQQFEPIPLSKPIPFKLFQDPTEVFTQLHKNVELHKAHAKINDFEDEKGDVENIPPKDYIQETNKRELSGILQPSKNIPFMPLEQQEESDEEEDIIYIQNNNLLLQNETLIPPCNTEQFVTAPFLASTPRACEKTNAKMSVQDNNDNSQKNVQPSNEGYHPIPIQSTLDNATCSKQPNKIENKLSVKDHSTLRGYTGQLSVIMESSRETYKSSSSGSSASSTRLSHFEQCFSQEKSNNQKSLTRFDEFKEPKPVALCPELTQCTNDRENTFGIFKEPIPLSQKTTFCATTKRVDTSKELKSENIVKESFQKKIAEKSDDTQINSEESGLKNKGSEIYCADIDPFDEDMNNEILQSLPNDFWSNLHTSEKALRNLEMKDKIEVGSLIIEVVNLVSEGAYGKVYGAEIKDKLNKNPDTCVNSKVALKLCKKCNNWELYICNILHRRLTDMKKLPDVRKSVMEIISAHRYSNTLVLTSEFSHQGTLLDLVNFYKKQQLCVPECITMYLTLEMLHIISQIHECQIIHGDIKPDNILIRDISNPDILDSISQKTIFLKLIDFGRSIDLKAFKRGICFETTLKDGCIEMKEKKPWVFQIDWYGLCNCIHVLLFSEYMKVKKNPQGRWKIEKNIKRYWDQALWSALFDELLNIPACYQEPNILKYTSLIESHLDNNSQMFKMNFQRLLNFFVKK